MKTEKLLKLALAMAAAAVLLLVVSCDAANNPSALVGHWLHESGSTRGKPENIELFKDGTGVCDRASISWKVENKRLILLSSLEGVAADYKVSNYELILAYDDGTSATFVKKGYEEAAKEARIAAVKAKYAKVKKGSFTDSRDGKSYKTVKFDNQTWMAENLNYNASGSKCYDNSESNCQKYGRLYDWETAKSACPKGWHLPSDEEWQILVDFAGGSSEAGTILKASSGWAENGNGTDAFGFSALPGGDGYSVGFFYGVGEYGYWWSATEYDASNAYGRYMVYSHADVRRVYYGKSLYSSVRCAQD